MAYYETNYEISPIANWFHGLNHLKYNLKEVNSTFDYENSDYIESIFVFMTWPVIALVLLIIFYALYSFCICLCISDTSRENVDSKGCQVFIVLFAIVSGLTFIVGLFGTIRIRDSLQLLDESTHSVSSLLASMRGITANVSNNINIYDQIYYIRALLHNYQIGVNQTRLEIVNNFADEATLRINQVFAKVNAINFLTVNQEISDFERIRWIVTLSTICFLALIAVLFVVGVCFHWLLVTLLLFGLISMIICSLTIGLTLGVTVAVSDFCVAAKPYMRSKLISDFDPRVLDYYIDCVDPTRTPFHEEFDIAHLSLSRVTEYIESFESKFTDACEGVNSCDSDVNNVKTDILSSTSSIWSRANQTTRSVLDVMALIDCRLINNELNASLSSLCRTSVEGLVMLFINSIAAALTFTLLVLCATYYARAYNPNNIRRVIERI